MADSYEAKYVGDKINAVKMISHDSDRGQMEMFVTGTYDSLVNKLSLWSIKPSEDEEHDRVLQNVCHKAHRGDVSSIDFHGNTVVTASGNGSVSMYRVDKMSGELQHDHSWNSLHKYKSGESCPCTDISIGEHIASCGEDGSINILDIHKPEPIRSLVSCDSTTLTSVIWVSQQCVAVVNTCGQLKVFDVRQSGSQPVQTFVISGELNVLNCLEKHPSQHHLVATGSYNGLLGIYDLRQDSVPVTILDGHNNSSINDIKFHPRYPDSLFSCASDGSVWQWNSAKNTQRSGGDMDGPSSWFLADAAKHRVEVVELSSTHPQATSMQGFEVNCIDVRNNTLVCASDNGAIGLFYDIQI